MKNKYFPLFVDLSEKQIVVIGAGNIASRRVRTLLSFADHITVVSPDATEEIAKLDAEGRIHWIKENYSRERLADADLVLACTDHPEINSDIHAACKCLGIPVNLCNDRTRCDFYFPGIVEKDNVVVGITASGSDHHLARQVREIISSALEKI